MRTKRQVVVTVVINAGYISFSSNTTILSGDNGPPSSSSSEMKLLLNNLVESVRCEIVD